ncbi:YafY family protein [Sinomonas halotolerans]|uniref:YafY family protein n=1 Tax=Sinomonas halotolerans TaxID=1644133 RepID=A0ABU9WZ51_9MICC
MGDTTQRVLSLLSLLQSRPVWTGPELAERLGVTTRSIRRDVERLRDLGYPVRAAHGAGGGYQLGAGMALPPLLLDDEEAVAVAVSLRLAAGGSVAGLGEAAVRSLAKLDQVLPARLRAEVKGVIDATVSLDGPVAPVDADVLVALARAIRTPERASFDYTKPDGARSERRVEPYRLVAAGQRWYLMAWDLDREDWRTFRLDRMAAARGTGWRFAPREAPDAVAYVHASITQAPYQFTARVRVHAAAHEVAARVPPSMAVVEPEGEATLLTAGADDLDYIAYHVARLGWPFTVVDPPELRAAVQEMGERLSAAARG